MNVEIFKKFDFFTGVPDSLLKPLCDWLQSEYGDQPKKHITAANEGNAVAIAAGYHLATGKVPVVYLQNSGIGNIANPVASLTSEKVYGLPMLFVVGWRGEPGVADEPQHAFQGEITIQQLEAMGIATHILDKNSTEEEFAKKMLEFEALFAQGKSAAFVVRKGALSFSGDAPPKPKIQGAEMLREDILKHIVKVAKDDITVATTGKAARELFEIRKQNGQTHERDFLTVGSMGHCSSIALGIALHNPNKRVWIIDGDGSALMHMGAMATIGAAAPKNLIHIIINNASHESVGDMPTIAGNIDFDKIAINLGYAMAKSISNQSELNEALKAASNSGQLSLLEIKSAVGSRADLGRPTISPAENKEGFMTALQKS